MQGYPPRPIFVVCVNVRVDMMYFYCQVVWSERTLRQTSPSCSGSIRQRSPDHSNDPPPPEPGSKSREGPKWSRTREERRSE